MSDHIDPLRAEVMAQPAHERVEYALDLLRFYLDPVPAFYQGCADLGLALANADMRMIHALDRKRGKFVSLNALVSARCLDRPCDEWGTPEKVVAGMGAIRRRLATLRLPVQIETWRGVGYCLEAPAAFTFEDGGAAWRALQERAA